MSSQTERYKRLQATYDFTDLEIKQLHYGVSIIWYECSKFIIMGILFGIMGLLAEYMIAIITLLPIRIFGGGLHFNHYVSCFLFTTFFIACPIFLRDVAMTPESGRLALLALCLVTTALAGPVTSKKRPLLSHRRYCNFRRITCGLLIIYMILFGFVRTFPGENICLWVIVLQTIQLACAKLLRKGEIYEKNDSRSTV